MVRADLRGFFVWAELDGKEIVFSVRNTFSELKDRYRRSQIKAASSVNRQLLLFYWSLGRDVALLKAESRWGSSFVKTLSEDLRAAIPDAKGFSRTNLFYMIAFYKLYQMEEKVPQLGGQNASEENWNF